LGAPLLSGIAGAFVGALVFAFLARAVLHDSNMYRSYTGIVGLAAGFLVGLAVALPDRFAPHAWAAEAAPRRLRHLRWLAYALGAVSGLAGLVLILLLEGSGDALVYLLGVPVAVVGSGIALRWFGQLKVRPTA